MSWKFHDMALFNKLFNKRKLVKQSSPQSSRWVKNFSRVYLTYFNFATSKTRWNLCVWKNRSGWDDEIFRIWTSQHAPNADNQKNKKVSWQKSRARRSRKIISQRLSRVHRWMEMNRCASKFLKFFRLIWTCACENNDFSYVLDELHNFGLRWI